MSLLTFKRRIGITGLRNSGKTVFLTSLINHIKDHDPGAFPIGNGRALIRRFQPLDIDSDQDAFNYEKYRDTLSVQGRWPEKTRAASHYRCSFERSDWIARDIEIEFYDFPGERIADASMIEKKTFAGWSDDSLRRFDNEVDYREHTQAFLDLQQSDTVTEAALIEEYKLALARLILHYKPLITPSTFLLGAQGDQASGKTPEDVAKDRYCGLSADQQFVPLSSQLRARYPDLAAHFENRFDDYKKTIVKPVFDYLKDCHRLIVLVDVTTLLAAGVGMYSDNKEIIDQLMNAVKPGATMLRQGVALLTSVIPVWKPGGVTRVAFVASKADKALPSERDKLLSLLKQMTQKRADDIDGLEALYATASAIVSTELAPGSETMLAGRPVSYQKKELGPEDDLIRFNVSPVPEHWPNDWSAGEYQFPDVFPVFPKRRDKAPRQFGLERVFDFLLKERLSE
ncbi:MAG: YcjX family protein [Planctomycetota bacterium]